MEEKKLGLKSVISVSVGLVIATSCLVSLGQGAGTIGVTFIFAMVIKSNWFMYQCRDGACPVSTTGIKRNRPTLTSISIQNDFLDK